VNSYQSDQEQLESLKAWWKENGRTVVVGVVLGLAGVVGWSSWQAYTRTQAARASMLYEQLLNAAGGDNYAEVDQRGTALLNEYPKSGYAPLAALVAAREALGADEVAAAKQKLRWVVDHAERLELRLVAKLRLARVLFNAGDHDAALALVSGVDPGGFAALYAELRGDILAARQDFQGARSAYQDALSGLPPVGSNRDRVRMKLDDLGLFNYPPANPS
jgi:predicted negative regulator of RcsB-dependent stress response